MAEQQQSFSALFIETVLLLLFYVIIKVDIQ